jgi:hypothetical protein
MRLLSWTRLPETLNVGPPREFVTVVGTFVGPTPGRREASDSTFLFRSGRFSIRWRSIVEPTVELWVSTPNVVERTVTLSKTVPTSRRTSARVF